MANASAGSGVSMQRGGPGCVSFTKNSDTSFKKRFVSSCDSADVFKSFHHSSAQSSGDTGQEIFMHYINHTLAWVSECGV